MLSHFVELALALFTVGGLVYSALALLGARSYTHRLRALRATLAPDPSPPGVSLLKPLRGADDALFTALESHCLQAYAGPVEILCGVRFADDPAVRIVADLQALYPHVDLRLIVCPDELGSAGKVATLVQLVPHARYDHLLVNDADIVVGSAYLTHIMQGFRAPDSQLQRALDKVHGQSRNYSRDQDPSWGSEPSPNAGPVGMVTAPYIGTAHADPQGRIPVWSRLEALGISTEFFPGVLTARLLEHGLHFGLGSTLAMRVDALAAIGGFSPLLESLADDYELGARIARAGFRVELAGEVVRTAIPPYTAQAFFDHQLRWARSTRDSRRLGYLGLGITFCIPWAMLTVVASGLALWSLALLSLALLLRVTIALTIGVSLLGDGQVLRDLWLLPLRDVCGLIFWFWSFAGDTVVWRGERFRLRDGKLHPLTIRQE